jgi:glyoxylase-like metal-dependent hydrolase (beta-lactamase superfamily II)
MTKYSAPEGELRELAPGVYVYLQPPLKFTSNAGLIVGKEEAVVIDSLTNRYMAENFIAKIRQVTDKPVRFLINTHWHADHTWTNHFFPEAKAIATARCRQEVIKLLPGDDIAFFKGIIPEHVMSFEGAKYTPQDIVFENTLSLYLETREIRIIDLGAAHTQSDSIVYLPHERIVFCGDLVLDGLPPQLLHGYMTGTIRALDFLSCMDTALYVMGHGPTSTDKRPIYESREYVELVRDGARTCFDKGMSLDEAAATIDIGKFKKWGEPQVLYANCARAYSEFRGEPPACDLPEEILAKVFRSPEQHN